MWVCRFTCYQKYIRNKNKNQCIAFLRGVFTLFGWCCKVVSMNWAFIVLMHIPCIDITSAHVDLPLVWLLGINLSEIFNKQTGLLIQEHFHEFIFSKSFTSIFVPALVALMIHLINYIFNMICHSWSLQVTKWITVKFGIYSDRTAFIVIRMIGMKYWPISIYNLNLKFCVNFVSEMGAWKTCIIMDDDWCRWLMLWSRSVSGKTPSLICEWYGSVLHDCVLGLHFLLK